MRHTTDPAKTTTNMREIDHHRLPAKVVFSFAVGADSSRAVDGVLRNAVRFLTAPIMLHVSSNSRYHWGATLEFVANHSSQLLLNPRRLRVVKHTPSVLHAHIVNWLYCCETNQPCANDDADGRFVLMSTSQVLVRPGAEDWIRRYSMSASIVHGWPMGTVGIAELLDVTQAPGADGLRQLVWQHPREHNGTRCPGSLPRRRDSAALSLEENSYAAAFVRLLKRGEASVSRAFRRAPIVHYAPLEGSFYPFDLLRLFIREVWSGSIFEQASERMQNGTSCPCMCLLYANDTHGCGREGAQSHSPQQGCTGACTFEEILLPTFAAQRVIDEAEWRHASPPIVLSVLSARSINWSTTSNAIVRFGAAVLRQHTGSNVSHQSDAPGSSFCFAIKVPHHAFPETELLRERARQLAKVLRKAKSEVRPAAMPMALPAEGSGEHLQDCLS